MGLSGQVMTRMPRLRGWEHGHTVKDGRALPVCTAARRHQCRRLLPDGFLGRAQFRRRVVVPRGPELFARGLPGLPAQCPGRLGPRRAQAGPACGRVGAAGRLLPGSGILQEAAGDRAGDQDGRPDTDRWWRPHQRYLHSVQHPALHGTCTAGHGTGHARRLVGPGCGAAQAARPALPGHVDLAARRSRADPRSGQPSLPAGERRGRIAERGSLRAGAGISLRSSRSGRQWRGARSW